jgi:hypothetical protein
VPSAPVNNSMASHSLGPQLEASTVETYPSLLKATRLIVAAITAAIGYVAPAGSAVAEPIYPVPFMEHDGTYLVGKDIRPGLYMTWGATGGGMCSWARLSSTGSGDAATVIDRGESSDAQYALIAPTDKAFETLGCQTWSIGTRPATPIPPAPPTCIYPLTGCQDPDALRPSP